VIEGKDRDRYQYQADRVADQDDKDDENILGSFMIQNSVGIHKIELRPSEGFVEGQDKAEHSRPKTALIETKGCQRVKKKWNEKEKCVHNH